MFEPSIEDSEWKELQKKKVMSWRLFQSCGIHILEVGSFTIFMLVEKAYPLDAYKDIVTQMVKGTITLQMQKNYWFDYQAYDLLEKYERILDPKPPKQPKQ